jgi:parallel beta-helix repeat protein
MKRIACSCLVIGILVFGFISAVFPAEHCEKETSVEKSQETKYATHVPIRINSDTDFANQFTKRLISGFEINGFKAGYCIYIGNCSQAFTISNCHTYNSSGKSSIMYYNNIGIYIFNSKKGTIINNNVSKNDYGIFITANSEKNIVKNNQVFSNKNDGITLNFTKSNTVENNTIFSNKLGFNFKSSATNNTIKRNRIFYNTNSGMYLGSSSRNIITDNELVSNTAYGIWLFGASQNNISYNTISDHIYGLWTRLSTGNTFMGNNLTQNAGGFDLRQQSNGNILTRNTYYNNTKYGLWCDESLRNNITYNNFTLNKDYAINFTAKSKFNRVDHNNFVANHGATPVHSTSHVQVCDTNGTNIWNTSTEGNHWFDWTTPDTAPVDGIVDQPYIIDGANSPDDFKPLTTPVNTAGDKIGEGIPMWLMLFVVILVALSIAIFRLR